MKLPKWTIVAIGLLLVMVLGACGSKYGSPEAAAETFFDAYEAQDTEAIKDSVCEPYQDSIPDFDELEEQSDSEFELEFDVRFNEDEDIDVEDVLDIDVDDISGNGFLAEADDIAVVNVYGTMRQRLITDERDTEFKTHSRDDHPLMSIIVIKDGDEWKVCDQDGILGLLN